MSNDSSAPPTKQMNYIPAGVSEQMAKRSDQPPEKKEGLFLIERFKENPFVFAGLAVTVGALVRGVGTMTKGDEMQQNRMMRLRIGGQAFTVAAFVAGCALGWHGPVIETVERWKVCLP